MKSIEFQKIGWTCNHFDRLTRFAISRWSSRSFFLEVSLSCHVTVRTISRLSQSLVGPVESLGRLGLSLQGLQNSPQFSYHICIHQHKYRNSHETLHLGLNSRNFLWNKTFPLATFCRTVQFVDTASCQHRSDYSADHCTVIHMN